MSGITFFDCNCSFGMRGIVNPGSFYKLEDLIERMKYYGIDKALVYHALAKEYNPAVGNSRLMEEIAGHPSLYPVWAVMPHHTGEFPEPEVLAGMLKENNVRAVRLFPGVGEQNFCLASWNSGPLLEMLQDNNVPILVGLDPTNWNGINELCEDYPKLKIILTEAEYRIDRNIYPLFSKFENLHLEIMGYKVSGGIEEICSKFGAHRLIFGSGMPVLSGGAAMCLVNYARITEAEKRMIASENLERLIGGAWL